MKKITSLFILLIITGFQLYSQKSKDVLYLKNGSIINGTIFEIANDQYKIRTSDNSVFVFQAADVDKYVKEASGFVSRKEKGMGFSLEAGFLIGSQESEYVLPFSFNCILNVTVATSNIIGFGTGVEFFGQTFSPLFVEYKRLIFEKKTSPFIFMRGGGLIHVSNDESGYDSSYPQYNVPSDYKGGASLTIGTGISWAKEESETYLSFAYRYARTSYVESNYQGQETKFENNFNRLEIKFGFKF